MLKVHLMKMKSKNFTFIWTSITIHDDLIAKIQLFVG